MFKYQRGLLVMLLCLITLLASVPCGQAQSSPIQVVINDVTIPDTSPTVETSVSVLAGDGSAVTDLPSFAFSVFEDGVQVEAQVVEEQVGLAIVILMDLSGSMKEAGVVEGQNRLQSAKEVAEPFIVETLPPDDWVGIIGFHVDQPYTQELTQDHGAARNTVTQMAYDPNENTALLNTTSDALDWLRDHPYPAQRKLLLIFSDGKDYLVETDPVAYEESREAVARKAKELGVSIYTVGIDSYCAVKGQRPRCVRSWPENAYSSQDVAWLAEQTRGGYVHYGGKDADSQDNQAVDAFLQDLVSHGRQYRITYPTRAAKGQHEVEVQVTVDGATSTAKTMFYSPFELPIIRLISPPDGFSLDLQTGNTIRLEAEVTFPDGRSRDLEKVIFYDGSSSITTLTTPPYAFDWDVSALKGSRTLKIEAFDTIIRDRPATSDPMSVSITPVPTPTPTVTPTPTPTPFIPPPPTGSKTTWLMDLGLRFLPLLLVIVVVAIFIVIISMRRQIATRLQKTTTWVKTKTAFLGGSGPTLAKLLGPGGTQYTISSRHVTFGREPQLCDQVILDRHISGKHFSIIQETDTFYIVDEQSTNGTQLNGQPIQPNQRYPLTDGALISVGQTNLQFRIGDVTVALS